MKDRIDYHHNLALALVGVPLDNNDPCAERQLLAEYYNYCCLQTIVVSRSA
jgi:hypothetical protein